MLVASVSEAAAQTTLQGATHLGGKASSIIQLTETVAAGEIKFLQLVVPGVGFSPFALPPKSVLVVTDFVLFRASGGSAIAQITDGVFQRFAVTVPDGDDTRTVSLGSGMVFTGGPGIFNGGTAILTLHMTGYLVKDK